MSYVEWLRVRNCLRTTAIILGILVVLALILRISFARYMSPEAWVNHISLDPGTTKSQTVLPDGTKRTILDDPAERTHVTIDDRGSSGTHIVITEPVNRAHAEHDHVSIGSIHVSETRQGAITTTTVDTNGAVPMLYYMGLADLVAIIVATILAAPFAREIDGHLAITLTKPISRLGYALGAVGADIAGILGASLMTILAGYLCQLLFETPRLDFSGINTLSIVMGIACPLAWYALVCAATTWFPRAYVGVMAFSLPIAGLILALTHVAPSNVVAYFIHDIATVLNRLDPLGYVSLAGPDESGAIAYAGGAFGLRLGMQGLLFVVYLSLALWRWERVEA